MEKNKIMSGVSNLYTHFFRDKTRAKESYAAYKALIMKEIYELSSKSNVHNINKLKDPNEALYWAGVMFGLKRGVELIEEQYFLSKAKQAD
jgi:hypothetical protein